MLAYEKQALLDLLTEDCLLVFGEGILYEHILLGFLESYLDPGTLVLVVECPQFLEEWLMDKMATAPHPPHKITAELTMDRRAEHYLEGGVNFVSRRILVIDLLQGRLPADLITGLVFLNAQFISDISIESFITRLYRAANKDGFIKAFSSNPNALCRGAQAEQTMRHLFIPKFHLWPRFHVSVAESVDAHKCEVIELHIPLSESMKAVQGCLVELLQFCLRELRRLIPTIEADNFSIENAVCKNYYHSLKALLKPQWGHLGSNTRQLLDDVGTISALNNQLTQEHAVKFHESVRKLRPIGHGRQSSFSTWMFTDSFERLLRVSKQRVSEAAGEEGSSKIELSQKWEAVEEVLAEVREAEDSTGNKNILFCVSSHATARQIVRFIKQGEAASLAEELTLSQRKGPREEEGEEDKGGGVYGLESSHSIHFLVSNRYSMVQEHLAALDPTYVILYDPDLYLIRSLEMFRCRRPGRPLRIYFLLYDNSLEEQRYLTQITREKESFEKLIHLKSTLPVHADQDGRRGLNPLLDRGPQSLKFADAEGEEDTREKKKKGDPQYQKVIVDMREFRSSLPSILHKSGLDLIPKTIEIGDYVLTPEICVERKSISDLIGSLASGRLFQQCTAMCASYRHPVLLIEFDESRGFSLQNYSEVGDSVTSSSLQTQLALLTIHFPKLRLLWSQSEYTTASMFKELKKGKPDPDDATTAAIPSTPVARSEFDRTLISTLLELPGVSQKNYFLLARRYPTLSSVARSSLAELESALESKENARKLFEFFNKEEAVSLDKSDAKPTSAKSKYSKFKKFRK